MDRCSKTKTEGLFVLLLQSNSFGRTNLHASEVEEEVEVVAGEKVAHEPSLKLATKTERRRDANRKNSLHAGVDEADDEARKLENQNKPQQRRISRKKVIVFPLTKNNDHCGFLVKPDPFAGRSFASLLKPAPVPVPEVVAPAQPAEKPRRWTKLTKKNGSVLFSKAARGVTEEVKPVEEQKVDVVQAVAVEVEVVQPVRVEKQEEVPVVEASRIAPLPAAPVAARPPKIVSQLLTAPSAVMLPSTIGKERSNSSFCLQLSPLLPSSPFLFYLLFSPPPSSDPLQFSRGGVVYCGVCCVLCVVCCGCVCWLFIWLCCFLVFCSIFLSD